MVGRSLHVLFAVSCIFGSVATMQQASIGQESNVQEFPEPLKRIKTPLPSTVTEAGLGEVDEVSRWMSDIVVRTMASDYECSVTYIANRSGLTKRHMAQGARSGVVMSTSGCFRMGKQLGTGVRRVLATYQPAIGHDFDRDQLARRTRLADIYQRDGLTTIAIANGHAANDHLLEGTQGKFAYFLNGCGAFHPARACVTPLLQTMTGGSLEITRHSVLPSIIAGVCTVGDLTHVFIDLKRMQAMVTFRDKCPVQIEVWQPRGESENEREITDVIRSTWSEVARGVKLPTRIQGMHLSEIRAAELNATVSWRHGSTVDQRFFDKETLGALLPRFSDENPDGP